MELFINNEKINITLENEKTIGDILKALELEAENNNATIVEISVDGKNVQADDYDETAKLEFSENTKIEVKMISQFEVDNSLKEVSELLCKNGNELANIPVLLQTGKNSEADLAIKNFADSFNLFCHTVSLTALFPEKYSKFLIGENTNINDFFKDFAPLVKDLSDAYESKDTVTVGDLCEYEISPRLLQISSSINDFFKENI